MTTAAATKPLPWLDEIEGWQDLVGDDSAEGSILEFCGEEVLRRMWATLPGVRIYPRKRDTEADRAQYRLIADTCGEFVAEALWKAFPGDDFYFAHLGLHRCREEYVRKHYRTGNVMEIAITLGVSDRYVEMIGSMPSRRPAAVAARSLFD